MANVICKYTYTPDLTSSPVIEIVDDSACAITEDTTIIVPAQSVSRPQIQNCETTITIKYNIQGPPVGGLEITHAFIDFYYNVVRGGYVGMAGSLNGAMKFPITDEVDVLESTLTYEIPNPKQALESEYQISFWPQENIEGEDPTVVKINDVSLRLTYRNLPVDPDIGAASNIEVYERHWGRMAVRWQAAQCANGKIVDHYSIAVFSVDSSSDPSLDGGTMVSSGWRSVPATNGMNGAFIDLETPQPNKNLFVKIVAVSTQKKRGIVTYSAGYSIPLVLDTLEDSDEVMFSYGNMQVAYNHVNNQASFIHKTGAPIWDHTSADDVITQGDYDRLARFIGVTEIPDVDWTYSTQYLYDDNGLPILDEWGHQAVKYNETDTKQTMMAQKQWAALIAKV